EFETDFLERESVRLADVVWSPSRHMLDWMSRRGWPRPRRHFVKQYIMLDPVALQGPQRIQSNLRTRLVDELVFFGRLETRKGLDLFCDAIDLLTAGRALPARVVFMGKIASVDGLDSSEYLAKRAERWADLEWRI